MAEAIQTLSNSLLGAIQLSIVVGLLVVGGALLAGKFVSWLLGD